MPFVNGQWITELAPRILSDPEEFGIDPSTLQAQVQRLAMGQYEAWAAGDEVAQSVAYNGASELPTDITLEYAAPLTAGPPAAAPPVLPLTTLPYSQPTHGDVVPGLLGTIVNGVPISGPGVPEPPHQMVAKHWHVKFQSEKYGTFQMFYWRLIDGRCMSYHSPTKTWKIWRPKKHIVISSNPRLKNLMKLDRLHKRMEKMVKKYAPQSRPKSRPVYQQPWLSAMEKKLLKAGGE